MSETGSVKVEHDSHIGTIEFSHPKGNSLATTLISEMIQGIENLNKEDQIKVIRIKSSGDKIFCAGASFDELLAATESKQFDQLFGGIADLVTTLASSPKIIVCEVSGKVLGGGVGIVAAADYCVATEDASIKLSELNIGLGPFLIGPGIISKIGRPAFTELALSTEWRDSTWSQGKGLYNEIVQTDSLESRMEEFLTKLSQYPSEALLQFKKFLRSDQEDLQELAKISAELASSDFTRDALLNFKGKKK